MHSIKTKLIFAISILVIFLFSVTAVLLINEKKRELSRDIYVKARALSELTSPRVIDLYNSFLKEKSFVIFNREIKDVFNKNEDIAEIKLFSFSGEVLYDSFSERERQYEGDKRKISDPDLTARVKASLPSYLLESGRTIYLKKDAEGNYKSVNENEKEISGIEDKDRILNIIYPLSGKFAVEFDVTYKALQARVNRMTIRILLLLVFGVLLGLGFAWNFSGKITNPIEKLTSGAVNLGKGDLETRVKVETQDEVGVLAETFNKMAADLQVSTKALVYKERMAKELEVAANIQKQILPKTLPSISGLDIATALVPAVEIGGDCYDFIQVDPDTHVIYLSDVTGHGIPSGIVVSIANALIYSYAKSPSLKDILINANRTMREKTASNMFMTLIMLRYSKGKLDYISAGHPEMLHYYAEKKKVVAERGGGIALGMVPDVSKVLNESSALFEAGDAIVLYSDGIPEAVNERGEQYGLPRMKRILQEAGELKTALAVKNALLADVKAFMGKAVQADDITLVVLKKQF